MKRNTYIILIACMATLAGCSNQEERAEDAFQPIVLSAGVEASAKADVLSRVETATTFPNGGRIGVIAAEGGNWTSYTDIQNAAATTTTKDAATSVYNFAWETAKYWPWPKSDVKLKFLAYSPKAADDSAVVQDKTTNTTLNLTLQATNMPDVLYTDQTVEFGHDGTAVDLGTFKHALSKVVVEVKADTSMNSQIRVTHLRLTTPNQTAVLDLLKAGDNAKLTLGAASALEYSFINNVGTAFTTSPIVKEALVFPGTQGEGCKVSITLKDGVTTLTKDFKITDFTPDAGSTPITFERAKTSVLTITVKGQKVEAGAIKLQGKLTDWNYQGKYESTIE